LGRVLGAPTNGVVRMDTQRADTEVRAPATLGAGLGGWWFLVGGPAEGQTWRFVLPRRWWWALSTFVLGWARGGDRLGNPSHGGHRGPRRCGTNLKICPGREGGAILRRVVWSRVDDWFWMDTQRGSHGGSPSRGAGGGPRPRMLFGGCPAETGWETRPTAHTEVRPPRHAFSGPGPRWFFDSDAAETGWETYPTRRQVGKPVPRRTQRSAASWDKFENLSGA
jgi:hypothetical protein